MKTTEQRIVGIISRAAMIDEGDVRPEARLAELGVSSLDQIECVLVVEEAFQIEVDTQTLWQLSTVQDVIDAVDRAVAARAR